MRQTPKQEMQLVAGFVPTPIKTAMQKIADDNDRTISWVVRKLLAEAPEVKAAIRAKSRANGNGRR